MRRMAGSTRRINGRAASAAVGTALLIAWALASAKPPDDAQGFCDWLAVSVYEEQDWLDSTGREVLDLIHNAIWDCGADSAQALTLTLKGLGEISPLWTPRLSAR